MILGNEQSMYVDFNGVKSFEPLVVNQFEKNSRVFRFTLTDNNMIYTIPDNCTAKIEGTKADNNIVCENCVIEDNQVMYQISEQFSASAGDMTLEIVLYKLDPNGVTTNDIIFRSSTFIVKVTPSALKPTAVQGNSAISTIDKIIQDYQLATKENTDIAIQQLRNDMVIANEGLDIEDAIPVDADLLGGQPSNYYIQQIKIATFTATSDNTSTIIHNLDYSPLNDDMIVIYRGVYLELGVNYIDNADYKSITLTDWSIATGEKITFKLYKNIIKS